MSALHSKFFPKDVNMMSANSCLELNFIIQLIRYCQYSRHISRLKFYLSEINVLQSLNGILCENSNEVMESYLNDLFWVLFHFLKFNLMLSLKRRASNNFL